MYRLFFIIIAIMLFAKCRKDHFDGSVIGIWQLVKKDNSIWPDKRDTLKIYSDGHYEKTGYFEAEPPSIVGYVERTGNWSLHGDSIIFELESYMTAGCYGCDTVYTYPCKETFYLDQVDRQYLKMTNLDPWENCFWLSTVDTTYVYQRIGQTF